MILTILGNNSAIPSHGRHPTAQTLAINNELILIDCGEGTQMRLSSLGIKRSKLSRIFISHLHGDHYFGLIGLLTSLSLGGRQQDLSLYGPPALLEIINLQLAVAESSLCYELNFIPITTDSNQVVVDEPRLRVTAFATKHRITCHGFKFEEIDPYRHLISEQIEKYGIPPNQRNSIVLGQNFVTSEGVTVPNDELTLPGKPTRIYCYCADTMQTDVFEQVIQDADLIYHETTYLQENDELAVLRYHSTTKHAAELAIRVGAKKLAIGHFSSKYADLGPFHQECSDIFPETHLAIEGKQFEI